MIYEWVDRSSDSSLLMNKPVNKIDGSTFLEVDLFMINDQQILVARMERKKMWFLKATLNGTIEEINQADYSKFHREHHPIDNPLVTRLHGAKVVGGKIIKKKSHHLVHLLIGKLNEKFWIELVLKGPSEIGLREISDQEQYRVLLNSELKTIF